MDKEQIRFELRKALRWPEGVDLLTPDMDSRGALDRAVDLIVGLLQDQQEENAKRFLETNIPTLVEQMEQDVEEYGNLHNEECGVNRENECDCENMTTIKSITKEWMGKVNEWWVRHATEHRKFCTPEGNKVLTRIMGRKNRLPHDEDKVSLSVPGNEQKGE